MNTHKHARLTPYGRALLVRRMMTEGLRVEDAPHVRTAFKWYRRYPDEGEAGLQDRPSRPAACPHQTPDAVRDQIIALRRERRTYRQINQQTRVAMATIGRVLQRAELNRLSVLDPPRPVRRYAWDQLGQRLHLDIKKLGRFRRPGHRVTGDRRNASDGVGWDYVHVAVDDTSRLALSTVHSDETARRACRALAEVLREWTYARCYDHSIQRNAHPPVWLHQYKRHRPRASLGYQSPVSILGPDVNNLVGLHASGVRLSILPRTVYRCFCLPGMVRLGAM